MEKWNACVEAKEDADFGRVSFANPLDQAPYYAIKVQPGVHTRWAASGSIPMHRSSTPRAM